MVVSYLLALDKKFAAAAMTHHEEEDFANTPSCSLYRVHEQHSSPDVFASNAVSAYPHILNLHNVRNLRVPIYDVDLPPGLTSALGKAI